MSLGSRARRVRSSGLSLDYTIKQSVDLLRKSTGMEKTLSKLTKRQKGNIQINKVRNNRVFVSLSKERKVKENK